MTDERIILCQINPLAFLEADEPWTLMSNEKPTPEAVLRFLCPAEERFDFSIEKLLDRYRKISTEPVRLSVAPADQRILEKLIWPLRNAKSSFMVGNILATIALSGMVAEMVAILLWKINDAQINGRIMTKQDEKLLFGGDFEKLGQEKRTSILRAYGIIDAKTKSDFDNIRSARNRYLHLWSYDHDQLSSDGIQCFHCAVSLVVAAIGQDFQEGRFVMNTRLLNYLDQQQSADLA